MARSMVWLRVGLLLDLGVTALDEPGHDAVAQVVTPAVAAVLPVPLLALLHRARLVRRRRPPDRP